MGYIVRMDPKPPLKCRDVSLGLLLQLISQNQIFRNYRSEPTTPPPPPPPPPIKLYSSFMEHTSMVISKGSGAVVCY